MESRISFKPKMGQVYQNHGGGSYLCLGSYSDVAIMQNISSGWTLTAHGIGIYEDQTIDWDFSTAGHFEEVPA